VEFEGLLAIAEALRNGSPAMAKRALPGPLNDAQIPELTERGRERVQKFFATLNNQLSHHACVAGRELQHR
jgi:hypothetical protein